MDSEYKRNLTFIDVFFVGLGYIVGAGIYSLLNITTKHGGNYTWLSFIIGGFISLMTAFSYYDLSKLDILETDSLEYTYITKTFSKNPVFKILVASVIILLGITTSSTLTIAFSNLIHTFFNKQILYQLIIFIVIFIVTLINIYDIKFTTQINMGISIVESSTLVLLILFSIPYWKVNNILGPINLTGVLYGAFLTIFAYAGFESVPKLTRKTINPRVNIPSGLMYSLIITIILYVFTSISTNSVLGANKTASLVNPLSHTFKKLIGNNSKLLVDAITLFSVFNTAMLTLLFTSSQLNEFARDDDIKDFMPVNFKYINKHTRTPIYAILFASILTLIICLFTNIDNITHITSKILFILFVFINLSAIIMKYQNILQVPNTRYIYYTVGLISSFLMILYN